MRTFLALSSLRFPRAVCPSLLPQLHLALCLPDATLGAGPLEALVRVIARLFELLQAISTRGLRAIRLCPVKREALTVIAGLGFELFNEPICHLMVFRSAA